jgi:hypothetical protein
MINLLHVQVCRLQYNQEFLPTCIVSIPGYESCYWKTAMFIIHISCTLHPYIFAGGGVHTIYLETANGTRQRSSTYITPGTCPLTWSRTPISAVHSNWYSVIIDNIIFEPLITNLQLHVYGFLCAFGPGYTSGYGCDHCVSRPGGAVSDQRTIRHTYLLTGVFIRIKLVYSALYKYMSVAAPRVGSRNTYTTVYNTLTPRLTPR